MVIGLLALTSIPTVTGISLGCSEQRKQNRREDDGKRLAKFYTDVECTQDIKEADELDGKRAVLRNNKVSQSAISCNLSTVADFVARSTSTTRHPRIAKPKHTPDKHSTSTTRSQTT